ncbi:rust resistance kinase Lr10-like [Magnolia sinica]|uniref:rust resistance kinase Lr10-like n=1 Tax=Magnolia sinica TaxID=86752 RepID=UPI00265A2511|nr:rust resistance kinase Lr10-like [Magnolia sinica]XP_058113725.1 rust resistance kinase Lr10-like [Magnolia sinica]
MSINVFPSRRNFMSDNGFSDLGGSFDDTAKSMFENWSKSVDKMIGGAILYLLVMLAIALTIIICLKRAGMTVLTSYLSKSNSNVRKIPSPDLTVVTDNYITATAPLTFMAIPDRQAQRAAIDIFFSDMARARPIQFSPQQLEIFTHNYTTRLGSGGYGVVYKGEFPNGMQIAVKVIKGQSEKEVEEQFMAEVGTVGRTHHINLVKLYGFCFNPEKIALVYEYMGNGSIDKLLFDKDRLIGWDILHKIAVGTAKGIAYLHEECDPRIIHYDIKPENVLLGADFTPKVADFGLAKLCTRNRSLVTNNKFKGTPGYAAPEIWGRNPITHKCDVYSFGILLFEIVGRRRHAGDDPSENEEWFPVQVWKGFENGELAGLFGVCGISGGDGERAEKMVMVALWCAQRQPEARPVMSDVVKMLEGRAEIPMPPNPFQHLISSGRSGSVADSSNATETKTNATAVDSSFQTATDTIAILVDPSLETATEGIASVADSSSADICSSIPIMSKYEIQLVTLP